MIDLYTWPTPNGQKVQILLEELDLPYTVHPVNIGRGEQFEEAFLRISPNNKIPAVVIPDGPGGEPLALFESGAILLHLAEAHGAFLPAAPRGRAESIQWLMFQMGGLGPMLGQAHHFTQYAPDSIEYAIKRYTREANRLYGVLDRRLGEVEFLAGDYSIADIASYPWTLNPEKKGVDIADYPQVARWQKVIGERPGVRRGMAVLAEKHRDMDADAREILFGDSQYRRR